MEKTFLHGTIDGNEQCTVEPTASEMLAELLASPGVSNRQTLITGIIIGTIADISAGGDLFVIYNQNQTAMNSKSLCVISPKDQGRQCALMFENGDPARPIVMGLLHHPVLTINTIEEQQDIKAVEKIELQCGKASLTLSADGKIELRGTKITSHSTGLNQIRGASVKLN